MYLCGLTQQEFAALLGVSQQAVSQDVAKCLEHLIQALFGSGTPQPQRPKGRMKLVHPSWDGWMIRVLHNQGKWWVVPDDVRRYIQWRFGVDGLASDRVDYADTGRVDEYPFHRERRWHGVDVTFRDWWRLLPLVDEPDEDEYDQCKVVKIDGSGIYIWTGKNQKTNIISYY